MSEQKPVAKAGNRLSRMFSSIRRPKGGAQQTPSAQAGSATATAPQQTPAASAGAATATAPQQTSPAPTGPATAPSSQQTPAPATTVAKATAQVKATASEALSMKLRNHTTSNIVYCYITGTEVDTGRLVILQADGATWYYPASPSSTLQPLQADCNIALALPKQTRAITIPSYVAGARIWFSKNSQLTFYINPGPALVEPSVTNPADPNINTEWSFAEFTYTSAQMFMNISYVDFASTMPVALNLFPSNGGATQHVAGYNQDGLNSIANGLNNQNAQDGAGWNQLVVNGSNGPLRVLSPNSGRAMNGNLLNTYWDAYVNQVYDQYSSQPLTINTQAQYGNVTGQVQSGTFYFGSTAFAKPSSSDIWTCSTGPFAVTQPTTQQIAIIPRLAAAFNRSTLLFDNTQPDGATENQFYTTSPTNYYSKVVHAANLDGKGYAYPYDDVTRDGGVDQSGAVFGQARLMIVAVGGNGAGTGPAPEDDGVAAGAY